MKNYLKKIDICEPALYSAECYRGSKSCQFSVIIGYYNFQYLKKKKDFRQYSFDLFFGVFDGFLMWSSWTKETVINYTAVSINDGAKWLVQDRSELKWGTMDGDLWYCTV